jgi:hypothetical protein
VVGEQAKQNGGAAQMLSHQVPVILVRYLHLLLFLTSDFYLFKVSEF